MKITDLLKKEITNYPSLTHEALAISILLATICGFELFSGQEYFVALYKHEADKFLNDPLMEIFIAYFINEDGNNKRFIETSEGFEKYEDLENQVRLILPIECKEILKAKGLI